MLTWNSCILQIRNTENGNHEEKRYLMEITWREQTKYANNRISRKKEMDERKQLKKLPWIKDRL